MQNSHFHATLLFSFTNSVFSFTNFNFHSLKLTKRISELHKKHSYVSIYPVSWFLRTSHRDDYSKYLFFFSRTTFLQFSRKVYLFVERHEFSIKVYWTDMCFQGGSICSSNRPLFRSSNFPGASIFSSNRYSFSRKPYLVLEHIFFPDPYASNRYFVNRSRWLLS